MKAAAPDPSVAATDILQRAKAAGFALAGIARARPSDHARELRAWLALGKHGEMDFFLDDVATRCDPTRIMAGTKSFLVVADQYATRNDQPDPEPDAAEPFGRIARYARGRNYHEVMKRRLHRLADALRLRYPASDFRTCVDTAPVPEREIAAWAGLGWIGKNTMLIHPRLGSYFFLGVVATNMELSPAQEPVPESCGTCTRCIDACPTAALTPFALDATKCVAYLTIEHRGAIEGRFHESMAGWIFGCDICQEVCPHNSPRDRASEVGAVHPAYLSRRTGFALLDVLGWTEADRRTAFATSALKRATLPMMKRNALIALAHAARIHPDQNLATAWRSRIRRAATDPSEPALVRETAAGLLRRSR